MAAASSSAIRDRAPDEPDETAAHGVAPEAEHRPVDEPEEPAPARPRRIMPAGALELALAELTAEIPEDDRWTPPPTDALSYMLRLPGAVGMHEYLDDHPAPALPGPSAPGPESASGSALLDDLPAVARRRRAIERAVLQPLRTAFGGRNGIAEAPAMLAALRLVGALHERTASSYDRAVHDTAGRFHTVIGYRVEVARSSFEALRCDIAEDLAELGPGVRYLNALDAQIRLHTEARARELFARLAPLLRARFTAGLRQACGRLRADAQVEDIERWYEPGGWMHAHTVYCRRVVSAVCEHEWRALDGLLLAARAIACSERTAASADATTADAPADPTTDATADTTADATADTPETTEAPPDPTDQSAPRGNDP